MPYYALVKQASTRHATAEEAARYVEGLGEKAPADLDTTGLSVTVFIFSRQGPFKVFKKAKKALIPMLDSLVPHVANRGFVLNRHPSKLPIEQLVQGGEPPKALQDHVLVEFAMPDRIIAALRASEDSVAYGAVPTDCPDDINEAAWKGAIARGMERRAYASPTLTVCKPVLQLSRDEARKVAAALEIPGRGSMTAGKLREAIACVVTDLDLSVQVDPSIASPVLHTP